MKYKTNDIISMDSERGPTGNPRYKIIILGYSKNRYDGCWMDDGVITTFSTDFIENSFFVLDKEYIWNEQLKEILNEV